MFKKAIASLLLVSAALQAEELSTLWTLSADLLIWKANEERLDYAKHDSHLIKPHFDWNLGFREKFAYNPWEGDWEFHLQWTHIINKASGHKSEEAFPVWTFSDAITDDDFVTSSRTHWGAHTNLFDAVYGYHYKPTSWFTLTPWAGLRSTWIDQRFRDKYDGGFFGPFPDIVYMKNYFWGMGPIIGLDPEFFLGSRRWSIFVSGDVAMFGGLFLTKQKEYTMGVLSYRKKHHFGALRWNADVAAGLKWRLPFCHGRYAFTFKGGWEGHWFFLQNKLSQNRFHLLSSKRDLTLSGFFGSLQFEF